MADPGRERLLYAVLILVVLAAIAVIAFKAESLGWTSDSSAGIVSIRVDLGS